MLPQDQGTLIAQACVDMGCTSVSVFLDKDAGSFLDSKELASLKRGARLVLTRKLKQCEVSVTQRRERIIFIAHRKSQ